MMTIFCFCFPPPPQVEDECENNEGTQKVKENDEENRGSKAAVNANNGGEGSKAHAKQETSGKDKFHMPDSVRGLAHMGKTIPREPVYVRALPASINKLRIRHEKMEWSLVQETAFINIEEKEFASGAMRDAFKVTVERGCSCIKENQIYVGKRVKGGEDNAKVLKKVSILE